MTAPTTSWPATTGRRWRRCFSTSPAAVFRRPCGERIGHGFGYRAAPDRGDDPALLVSLALVVAAASGIAVLAGVADYHLGVPAKLHLAECRLFRPRRRHPDRRGDPVGHPVSRPARLFDFVSRGVVGAQSRQPA